MSYALPIFATIAIALMLLEHRVAQARGQRIHSLATTLSNLGCGALRLVATIGTAGTLLAVYHFVYSRGALLQLPAVAPPTWLGGFLLFDFGYYVMHRTAHRVPLLWAIHRVHHESRDFNLTVGARASVLGPLTAFPFYLPMAIVGIPTSVYAVVSLVGHVFMFLAHARFVNRFGPLSAVVNSPLHHRLHHSRLTSDRNVNFGGALIVWDRLLGTFCDRDAALYGLPEPTTMSPLAANWLPLRRWWRKRGRHLLRPLRVLFARG